MFSRPTKVLRLPLAALALVLTIFSLCSAPASAHWDYEEQGEDVAITSPDHMSGSVCDVERDGRFVSATWYDSAGQGVGGAEDGGDSQCSDTYQFTGEADIVKICESTKFPEEPPNSRCSIGKV
jgi:hypothetical protein